MSEVVRTGSSPLVISDNLAPWVHAIEDGASPPDPVPQALANEARAALTAVEAALTPVSSTTLNQWLGLIVGHHGALRRPLDEDQTRGWRAAVGITLRPLATAVFNRTNLAEVLARHAFLPSAADLMAVLQPDHEKLLRRADALRRLSGGTGAQR